MNDVNGPQAGAPPISFGQPPAAPLSFGQILDRIFRLLRANWRLFAGIAVIPATLILIYMAAFLAFFLTDVAPQIAKHPNAAGANAGALPAWLIGSMLCTYPLILLVFALYMAAACFATTQADRGVRVTFRQAYGESWSNYGRYVWLMLLSWLIAILPIMILAALIGGGTVLLIKAGWSPMTLFFLVPLVILLYIAVLGWAVMVMLRIGLALPASVEEDLTAWDAIRRSFRLTRHGAGRFFLVMLVVYAAMYAANLVCIAVYFVLVAIGMIGAFAAHVAAGSTAFYILAGLGVLGYALLIAATAALSYAGLTTALAVIYHDQRLRLDYAHVTTPAI